VPAVPHWQKIYENARLDAGRGTRVTRNTFAETEQEKTEPRLFTHEYTPRHGLALDYTKDRDV